MSRPKARVFGSAKSGGGLRLPEPEPERSAWGFVAQQGAALRETLPLINTPLGVGGGGAGLSADDTPAVSDRSRLLAAFVQVAVAVWLCTRGIENGRVQTMTADFRLWEPADKSPPCAVDNQCSPLSVSRQVGHASGHGVAAGALVFCALMDAGLVWSRDAALKRWAPTSATLAACHAVVSFLCGETDLFDLALGTGLLLAGAFMFREAEEAPPARRTRTHAAASACASLVAVVDGARFALGWSLGGHHFPGRARAVTVAQAAVTALAIATQTVWVARGGKEGFEGRLRRAADIVARATCVIAVV